MLNLPVVQKGREMAWAVSNHRIRGIDILQERHDTQVGWRTLGNSTFDRGKCDEKKWTELSSIEINLILIEVKLLNVSNVTLIKIS